MTDAQPLDGSQISYLKGVVFTLRGQKLSVDKQTMREILATIDNLTDQVAWLSAASNDSAKQIKALESERDALRAELDAANAAGEKLACDLATVSAAIAKHKEDWGMTEAKPLTAEELSRLRGYAASGTMGCANGPFRDLLATIDAQAAQIAELEARAVVPTVKPLVWKGAGEYWICNVPFGHYELHALPWGGSYKFVGHGHDGKADSGDAEAVKAAVQTEFERRILSALDLGATQAQAARVKPLVWEEVRPDIFEAKSPAGKMMIYVQADGCMLDAPGTDTDSRRRLWKFADLQAAQSFAQREFDTAMVPFLSALDLGETQARPAPVVPDGWVCVPTADNWDDADPGCDMAEVLCSAARVCGGGAAEIYRALLAAAPPAPLLTEAQAGAKALREVADKLREQSKFEAWFSQYGIEAAADICRAEADRLEREGGNAPATAQQ